MQQCVRKALRRAGNQVVAVEMYHRVDGDTVKVTFDGGFYSDHVRLSRSPYIYCIDKHGRYAHRNGVVRVVSTDEDERCYDGDTDIWEDPEVTLSMPYPQVHIALYDKIHHLRIVL